MSSDCFRAGETQDSECQRVSRCWLAVMALMLHKETKTLQVALKFWIPQSVQERNKLADRAVMQAALSTNEALDALIMDQVGSLTASTASSGSNDSLRKRIASGISTEGAVEKESVDGSSTDSMSPSTAEAVASDETSTQTTQQQEEQSPLHAAGCSLYATSDSDSSCYMYEAPSSSDYEGCSFTQISNGNIARPDSLSLPRPLQYYERKRLTKRESESSISGYSRSSSTDALIEAASSTPLHVQGTVTREGDMVAFVAEGLTEMIKMSSPLTKKGKRLDHVESCMHCESKRAQMNISCINLVTWPNNCINLVTWPNNWNLVLGSQALAFHKVLAVCVQAGHVPLSQNWPPSEGDQG